MVDKKPQHENPFDDDDFDPFGDSDDFNLDLDDDDDIFQFTEDADDETHQTTATAEDEDTFPHDDVDHDYEFTQDDTITDEHALEDAGSGNPLINFIEQLKNNKQLLIYTLAGGLVGILIIAMVGKMFLASPATPKIAAVSTNPFSASNTTATANFAQPTEKPEMTNQAAQPTGLANTTNQQNNTLANQQAEPNAFTMPAAPTPSATAAEQAATADLQKRIENLEGQVTQLNAQIATNAQQNVANQEQIASLIKALTASQAQVDKLNAAMQALITAANQATSSGTPSGDQQSGYNTGSMQSSADYYVQAIIPGRAWLKNSQGQVITVGPGDPVPGYGTVTNINPQSGSVTTSTGTNIVFGINAD